MFFLAKFSHEKVSMFLIVNTDILVLTDFSTGIAGFLLHCSFAIFFPTVKKRLPDCLENTCNFRSMEVVFSYKTVLVFLKQD